MSAIEITALHTCPYAREDPKVGKGPDFMNCEILNVTYRNQTFGDCQSS